MRRPSVGGILISIGLFGLTTPGGPINWKDLIVRFLMAYVFLVGLGLEIDSRKGPE